LNALKQETEERLLVEAAQQDPRRFAALYERNFHRVYAYVSKRVPSREEAEDITSEVFHQALAKIGSFEWRGAPFASWLFRIAANTITDRWRTAGKEITEPIADPPDEHTAKDIERRALLFELVESLPADQRRVVTMRFVEQKKIREIALELGRTEGAVKQLQLRALENLRARLEGAHA